MTNNSQKDSKAKKHKTYKYVLMNKNKDLNKGSIRVEQTSQQNVKNVPFSLTLPSVLLYGIKTISSQLRD